MTTEKISVGEAVSFWTKYKTQIMAAIALIAGLLGGNADRVGDLVPTGGLEPRVVVLETKVADLEASAQDSGPIIDIFKGILSKKVTSSDGDTIKIDN